MYGTNSLPCCTFKRAATSPDRPIAPCCGSNMTGRSSSEEGSGASIAWGCLAPRSSCLVQSQGRPLGRFVMTPTAGYEVSYERRVVAVAIADQVGASLRPLLGSRV